MIDLEAYISGRVEEVARMIVPSLPPKVFNGKHQPCPYCHGTDRFRVAKGAGGEINGYYCGRGVGYNKKGSNIGMIAHLSGMSYKDTCRVIEDKLGIKNQTNEDKKETKKRMEIIKARQEEQKKLSLAKRRREHVMIANKATRIWESAKPPNQNHPYLINKKINGKGLRQIKNTLVAPVVTIKNKLMGLQFISEQGEKKFLKDQQTKNNMLFIGHRLHNRPVAFCEGYATGETIHNVTGLPVVVCFNRGNIVPVVKQFQELAPKQKLILLADNDLGKYLEMKDRGLPPVNAGTQSIIDCAKIGVQGIQPVVEDDYDQVSDWNDVFCLYGEDEFKQQVREQYEKLEKV